jgi:hypothetical protein
MESGIEEAVGLKDIWGSSGNDVFAVGTKGTILHYDGSHWSQMNSGTKEILSGIWGSSSKDVFAVGKIGYNVGFILHYDGNTWSEMARYELDSIIGYRFESVWGSAWNDVFVVGHKGGDGIILHYDGLLDTTTSTTSTTTLPIDSSTTTTSVSSCPSEQIYGKHSEKTELLRYYRDNVLAKTPEGKELIKLYYQWSTAIVRTMVQDEEFKKEIKEMIDGVLPMIDKAVE